LQRAGGELPSADVKDTKDIKDKNGTADPWLQNRRCTAFRALIARPDCEFGASKMPFGAAATA
jgi:hypothetical protein